MLDKIDKAYEDFKIIMEKEPDNMEVNGDLKECAHELEKKGYFKEKDK